MQHQISVIPKSVSKDRIIGNLDVLDWTIPDEDMKVLDTLDFQVRAIPPQLRRPGPHLCVPCMHKCCMLRFQLCGGTQDDDRTLAAL